MNVKTNNTFDTQCSQSVWLENGILKYWILSVLKKIRFCCKKHNLVKCNVDRIHVKLQNLMKFKFFSLIKYDVKTDIAFKCGFRK